VFRSLVPHHHHSVVGVNWLVAVHEPYAGVVTDETDDDIAEMRHNDRVLDDRIDAIPRGRPVYSIIQPMQSMLAIYINNLCSEHGRIQDFDLEGARSSAEGARMAPRPRVWRVGMGLRRGHHPLPIIFI